MNRTVDSPLYATWAGMMQRCHYTKGKAYKNYGGRGIKVCDRWHSFRDFEKSIIEGIGSKPSAKHTLDRIDNEGDYEPTNVRWSTRQQQVLNRRLFSNNKSGFLGVSWSKVAKKYHAQIRIKGKKTHLGYFAEKESAHIAYQEARKIQLKFMEIKEEVEYS